MNLVLTRGREGVQNLENLADVICALPLRDVYRILGLRASFAADFK